MVDKYLDLVKVIKVIKSCRTILQLETAETYYHLFLIKYNNDISNYYKEAVVKLLTIPRKDK